MPVLQRGKRYRFNGRLTCVINGKRRSAPKRTRIDILNTVGKRTFEKPGTTIRDKGRLTVILAYRSSRTDHVPVHQQRRPAFAGPNQGSGREALALEREAGEL